MSFEELKPIIVLVVIASIASLAYGKHLENNAVPITELPSDLICEHDPMLDQFLCYKEK
jgi:hypothetical protein